MIRFIRLRKEQKRVEDFKCLIQQFDDAVKNELGLSELSTGVHSPREIQQYIHQKCAKKSGDFIAMREKIAMEIPAIKGIANFFGISTQRISLASPLSGRTGIQVDIFDSILEDHGYVETFNSTRLDSLNKMLGIIKEAKACALIQLVNPLYWVQLTLKVPFLLIQQTGFNTEKIEEAFWGRFFKLVFLVMETFVVLKFLPQWG